jgi:16S rRNA (adenine1518-N6/adenine1519-N6)-dimethyltransferase
VVALVQKEVAQRLAAGPGSKSFGRLSIIGALYGQVELFQVVPRRSFVPTPEVDGQIVVYRSREGPLPVRSPELLEDVVRSLFSARRKQLKNLLPRVLPPGTDAGTLAADAGWPEDWGRLRPENLPPGAYFALANRLSDVAAPPTSARGRHV